ncbi:MAG TPA: sulfotransferase [Stellaceae bacterium]|nr:sulfotransferase [Stellaceae bacterium]
MSYLLPFSTTPTEADRHGGHPIAIGGIGGSGTRVVATLALLLGYYLGDDLSEENDNLWFTLLFVRRSILLERMKDIFLLLFIFFRRMSGSTFISERERLRIFELAEHDRFLHEREWLRERAASFCRATTSKSAGQPWGWKEPNSHIVADRILSSHPSLRYIYVYRHPLDMALSANQNQLKNWGPIFLDRDADVTPRLSLTFWCMAHRRAVALARERPARVMLLDFDKLCLEPAKYCARVACFAGVPVQAEIRARFAAYMRPPASAGRSRGADLRQFDEADLRYVAQIGYSL